MTVVPLMSSRALPPAPGGGYRFANVARMEWIKLRSLRSTWWSLAFALAGAVGIGTAVGIKSKGTSGDLTNNVLAGVALPIGENGHVKVRYASGLDLLRQTPKFVFDMRAKRLDGEFNRAYRYLEVLYGGHNPYMASIDRNLEYLQRILRSENWRLLRRQPPVFTGVEDSMATTRTLMLGAIKKVWG